MILSPYIVWLLCCWAQPNKDATAAQSAQAAHTEALAVVNAYIEKLDRGGMGAWEYHMGRPDLDTLDLEGRLQQEETKE